MKRKLHFKQFLQNLGTYLRHLLRPILVWLKVIQPDDTGKTSKKRPELTSKENAPSELSVKSTPNTQSISFEKEGMDIKCQISKYETSEILQVLLKKFQNSSN